MDANRLSFDLKIIAVMSDKENTMSCYDWRNMSIQYLCGLSQGRINFNCHDLEACANIKKGDDAEAKETYNARVQSID